MCLTFTGLFLRWMPTGKFESLLAKLLSDCDFAMCLSKGKARHLKACEIFKKTCHFQTDWIFWVLHTPQCEVSCCHQRRIPVLPLLISGHSLNTHYNIWYSYIHTMIYTYGVYWMLFSIPWMYIIYVYTYIIYGLNREAKCTGTITSCGRQTTATNWHTSVLFVIWSFSVNNSNLK